MTTGAGNIDVVMTLHGSEQANAKLGGFTAAVKQNQTAVSDLAMGATFMGASFLGMGAALESTDNSMLKSFGNIMTMVGGIMAFVGSSTMFIFAVSKMVESLKALHIMQIITKALSGPMGWAMLAGGAAVAGGAVYGYSRLTANTRSGAAEAGGPTQINVNVGGSVITEKKLVAAVQDGLAQKGQRNAGKVID